MFVVSKIFMLPIPYPLTYHFKLGKHHFFNLVPNCSCQVTCVLPSGLLNTSLPICFCLHLYFVGRALSLQWLVLLCEPITPEYLAYSLYHELKATRSACFEVSCRSCAFVEGWWQGNASGI